MAINWDSIQPNPHGFAGGLGGIAEAFRARRERELRQMQLEQQAAMEAAQLEQQRANQAAVRQHEGARLASEEQRARQRMEFEREQAEREAREKATTRAQDAIPKVADALRARRYSEAEMLGAAHGIALMPQQRPQDPGQYRPSAAPQRPQGQVNIDAAPEDIDRQIQAREQYNRDNTDWIVNELDAEEEHGEKVRAFQEGQKAEPVYYLNYGGKPLAVYRGGEAQAANEQDARRAAESFAPTATADFEKHSLDVMEQEIANGMPRPEAMKEHTRRVEAEKNRRARAALPRGRSGAGDPDKKLKTKLDVEQEYMQAAESTLAKLGYADVIKDQRKLLDMSEQVAGAANNAALASIVAGAFTKYSQGGTGVISDSDLKFFWGRIGGLGLRTWQQVQDVIDGRLHPEKQREVKGAVDALIAGSRRAEMRIGQALESNIGRLPGGAERLPRVLETYAPSYYRDWQGKRANSGAPDAVDAFDREADELLQGM